MVLALKLKEICSPITVIFFTDFWDVLLFLQVFCSLLCLTFPCKIMKFEWFATEQKRVAWIPIIHDFSICCWRRFWIILLRFMKNKDLTSCCHVASINGAKFTKLWFASNPTNTPRVFHVETTWKRIVSMWK